MNGRWNTWKPQLVLSLTVLLHIVLHLKYLNLPPIGFHQWRQTQTLAVARNFHEEELDLLRPRVDSRGNGLGITGTEFPLVNGIIAAGYQVFGLKDAVARTIILSFSILAIVFCYLFFASFFNSPNLGAFASFALAFSPLFSYYSIVVLPDVPALAFLFIALWSFWRYQQNQSVLRLAAGGIFLALAGLVKVSALIAVPVVFITCLTNVGKKHKWLLATVLLAVLFICSGWLLYARHLSETYHNFDFKLEASFPFPLSVVPQVSKRVFIQWLPELYINYAEFVLFVIGLFVVAKESLDVRRYAWIFAAFVALFMIAFYPMLEHHDYYMIPALPLLLMVTIVGFKYWQSHWLSKPPLRYLFILLLCLIPILGSIRALSRFEGARMSNSLKTIGQFLDQEIPNRNVLVAAASDNSPSIYLYFMHRKGWTITETVTPSQWSEIVSGGAGYLISDSRKLEEREEIASNLRKLSSYGEFNVFEIVRNGKPKVK